MLRVALALGVAALCFPSGPADAQLFRRAQACPTCPNGVCQPQASPAMFLPVPASAPLKLLAAATPCLADGSLTPCSCPTGCNCTTRGPTPTGRHYYVCPASLAPSQACPESPAATRREPAGSCTAAPSAGAFVKTWRPGQRLREFVEHRPRLFQRGNGCK